MAVDACGFHLWGSDMKKWKNDVILVAVIVLAAALLWLGTYLTRSEGAYVRVSVDGELFGEYPLDTDTVIRIGNETSYNLLVIEEGEASVTEASCPDKLCVHQGKIHYNGQSIVCLPNKVVIEVVGGEESGYDVVVK